MEINYWVVFAAAVTSMVVGSLWYGPLFGKKFMAAMGMNEWTPEKQAEMKKQMTLAYVGQFVASLLMFFVLAWYVGLSGHPGALGGVNNAFWIWIGFVVPLKLGDTLWGGKWTLFWLGIGNMFVTLAIGGAIIGAWR